MRLRTYETWKVHAGIRLDLDLCHRTVLWSFMLLYMTAKPGRLSQSNCTTLVCILIFLIAEEEGINKEGWKSSWINKHGGNKQERGRIHFQIYYIHKMNTPISLINVTSRSPILENSTLHKTRIHPARLMISLQNFQYSYRI